MLLISNTGFAWGAAGGAIALDFGADFRSRASRVGWLISRERVSYGWVGTLWEWIIVSSKA